MHASAKEPGRKEFYRFVACELGQAGVYRPRIRSVAGFGRRFFSGRSTETFPGHGLRVPGFTFMSSDAAASNGADRRKDKGNTAARFQTGLLKLRADPGSR